MSKNDDKKTCFSSVINKVTDNLDILLHDEIGFWGDDSKTFNKLLADNKDRTLDIDINSPGGEVFDGFAMYNAIVKHKAPVNITISGVAASIASVIAMAGDSKPEMPANTMLMVHKPYMYSGGDADEMRSKIDLLDKMQSNIIKSYQRHSDLPEAELNEMVNKTTWLTADEAGAGGFATAIEEPIHISNMYDFSMYNYAEIPDHVKELYKNKKEITVLDKISNLLNPSKKLEGENKTLLATNSANETKMTALDVENKDLKKQISDKKDADAKDAADAIEKDIDSFLNKQVKEGKLLPVNVETEKLTLLALDTADKDGKLNLVKNQKAKLEGSEKVVNLSPEEIANKGQSKGDSELNTATEKYMAENKCKYAVALSAFSSSSCKS